MKGYIRARFTLATLAVLLTPARAQALVIGPQKTIAGADAVCEIKQVLPNGSVGTCTGVLIDPTHIMTAAHCGPERRGTVTVYCANGRFSARPAAWTSLVPTQEFSRREGFRRDLSRRDVGLFVLRAPAEGITPIPYAETSAEIRRVAAKPDACVLAGFSPIGRGWFGGIARAPGTRLRATPWQRFEITNEHPPEQVEQFRGLEPWFAISGPDRFITGGDSGGPLLCPDGKDRWKVIAVHTAGSDDGGSWFTAPTGYSLSSWTTNYSSWLKQKLAIPLPPAPPTPPLFLQQGFEGNAFDAR